MAQRLYSCKHSHTLSDVRSRESATQEHSGSANAPYARFTEQAAEHASSVASTSGGLFI